MFLGRFSDDFLVVLISWGKFTGPLDILVCEVHLDRIKSSMVLGNCLVLGSLVIMEK